MDRGKMSNLYKGPSIDASYQVSVHLAEGFQRRRLKCKKLTDDGRQVMLVSSTNKTYHTEILLKLALNMINQTKTKGVHINL
jgi:hypothetical protein